MCHLLQRSITRYVANIFPLWVSFNSQNKQLSFSRIHNQAALCCVFLEVGTELWSIVYMRWNVKGNYINRKPEVRRRLIRHSLQRKPKLVRFSENVVYVSLFTSELRIWWRDFNGFWHRKLRVQYNSSHPFATSNPSKNVYTFISTHLTLAKEPSVPPNEEPSGYLDCSRRGGWRGKFLTLPGIKPSTPPFQILVTSLTEL